MWLTNKDFMSIVMPQLSNFIGLYASNVFVYCNISASNVVFVALWLSSNRKTCINLLLKRKISTSSSVGGTVGAVWWALGLSDWWEERSQSCFVKHISSRKRDMEIYIFIEALCLWFECNFPVMLKHFALPEMCQLKITKSYSMEASCTVRMNKNTFFCLSLKCRLQYLC